MLPHPKCNVAVADLALDKDGISPSAAGVRTGTDLPQWRQSTIRLGVYAWAREKKDFSDFPIDPRSRDEFLKWRDHIGKTSPRQADFAWSTIKLILTWALDRGLVKADPCERGGRLYDADRSDKIWLPEDGDKFLLNAPKRFHLPLLLGIYAGQRRGDLLKLPSSAYDGTYIQLIQKKTGMEVIIPVATKLKLAIDAKPKASPIMLVNSRGHPWKETTFTQKFHDAAVAAGIAGLTFHDTRGTCITRMAEAGCTVPEIVAITGRSLSVAGIVDKYLKRSIALAKSAIAKLETGTRLETKLET